MKNGGAVRVPLYLVSKEPLTLAAVSFAAGDGHSSICFVPDDALAPTLTDSGVPGYLAVAWLSEMRLQANNPLQLGSIELAGGSSDLLRILSVVANDSSGKDVDVALPQTASSQQGEHRR